jgi:hypothetical protein
MSDEFKHPVIQNAILNKYNESIKTELKDEVEALLKIEKNLRIYLIKSFLCITLLLKQLRYGHMSIKFIF